MDMEGHGKGRGKEGHRGEGTENRGRRIVTVSDRWGQCSDTHKLADDDRT